MFVYRCAVCGGVHGCVTTSVYVYRCVLVRTYDWTYVWLCGCVRDCAPAYAGTSREGGACSQWFARQVQARSGIPSQCPALMQVEIRYACACVLPVAAITAGVPVFEACVVLCHSSRLYLTMLTWSRLYPTLFTVSVQRLFMAKVWRDVVVATMIACHANCASDNLTSISPSHLYHHDTQW